MINSSIITYCQFLFMSISLISMLTGEVFSVTDIMINGDQDSRVNIVFLGDGYTQEEMNDYIDDVGEVVEGLFSAVPYSNYINYFNVFAIEVPSNESGTDHPGTAYDCGGDAGNVFYADTYFNSTFDYYGIHRLLVPLNTSAAYDVLIDNTPQWDIVFLMVNTTIYGGSGGAFATFSRNAASTEIAVHELGHSFAGLADEYWYSGWEAANMTQESNPLLNKWNPWLYDNDIGIYQYEDPGYNWYRPHQNCKMRYLGPPFCSVCAEQTIKSVYSILDLIDSYFPENLELIVPVFGTEYFSINPILNIPNSITIDWFIDEQPMFQGSTNLELEASLYSEGEHEVKVVVKDLSDLVRNDPLSLLESEVIWNMTIECNAEGDLNMDGMVNIQDVILLVNNVIGISADFTCADLNGDGEINIQDIIILVNIILSS